MYSSMAFHLITEGLFTSGHFMYLLWLDSYPIVKRPGVNAFQNTWDWFQFQMKLYNCKFIVETTYVNCIPPKMLK